MWIQLDETLGAHQSRRRRRYAVKAITARYMESVPTVVHLCLGYAAVVPGSNKPEGYSFLANSPTPEPKDLDRGRPAEA